MKTAVCCSEGALSSLMNLDHNVIKVISTRGSEIKALKGKVCLTATPGHVNFDKSGGCLSTASLIFDIPIYECSFISTLR